MKKIVITKKNSIEEKLKSYKKAARPLSEQAAQYKASIVPNKKKEYDKKDKSYKAGYE